MPNVDKSTKNIDADEREGLLTEYKTLRDEIISTKGRRLQTVSLTVGACGALLSIIAGVVVGSTIPTVEAQLAVAMGGSIALYGIVIPSQIMTIHLQQTIQRTGGYIRVFLEPRIPGLNWENRWHLHKNQYQLSKGIGGMGGIFYFLSLLPLLIPLYIVSQIPQNWPLVFALIPFLLWSLYLSYDMHAAISKGWKWQWEPNNKKNSPSKTTG